LFSFKEGMETLPGALAKALSGHISTDVHTTAISRKDSGFHITYQQGEKAQEVTCQTLVLTIPAYAYETLPLELPSSVRQAIVSIPYPPVSMVFFGYSSNPASFSLDGFGFLVPRIENRKILGTIWGSTLFAGRAKQGEIALTTFVGGTRQPENARLNDEELIEIVRKDLYDLMGIHKEPDVTVIQRWPKAIPQYTLDHKKVIQTIEDFERKEPGIYISGNFRGGISVGDCIKQANNISEQVAKAISR
jgi:oxygen-dependent protoporphyrinogen oxidase